MSGTTITAQTAAASATTSMKVPVSGSQTVTLAQVKTLVSNVPTLTGPKMTSTDFSGSVSAGAYTLDWDSGRVHWAGQNTNLTITVNDPTDTSVEQVVYLGIQQDATGGRTVTFQDGSSTALVQMTESSTAVTTASAWNLFAVVWVPELSQALYSHIASATPNSAGATKTFNIDGMTVGSAPSDVTALWAAATSDFTVQQDGSYTADDDEYVYIQENNTASGGNWRGLYPTQTPTTDWDCDLSTTGNIVEMRTLIRTASASSSSAENVGIIFCAATGATATGYWVGLYAGSGIRISDMDGTAFGTTDLTYSYSADTWYYLKVRAERTASGIEFKVRVWLHTDTEPSTWLGTWTDTSSAYTTGKAALGYWSTMGSEKRWGVFQIRHDGGSIS